MLQKKGLSAVVATIGLVLITFVAASIIISFVVPFVRDNLTSGSECFPYREYFSFDEELGFNCLNGTSQYLISVRAKGADSATEQKVTGLKLSFVRDGDTTVADIEDGAAPSLIIAMASGGNLAIPKSGEIRTYSYDSSMNFDSVEVFPKLDNGRVCDRTDSIKLEEIC